MAAGKFGGHHSEALLEFGEVPALAAEDADGRLRLGDGVALAGDGLDEGGLAAAVRAEDSDVLASVDGEVDVVEDDVFAAGYVYMGQVQEGRHALLEYCPRGDCVLNQRDEKEIMFRINYSVYY